MIGSVPFPISTDTARIAANSSRAICVISRQRLIKRQYGHGLAALFLTARAPCRDVDIVLSHQRSDFANHAGYVVAAEYQQDAFRDEIRAVRIDLHDTRLAMAEQRAADHQLAAAFPMYLAA